MGHELAAIFDEHASFVGRVLARCGVASADVEDAIQEVFVVVASKLSDYQERGGMRAWLFTIARQVASRSRRTSVRRERREREQTTPELPDDPHRALERSEAVRFVQRFLEELDPRQSDVFFLSEIEGLSAPEIAACLGVGLNTVYGRIRLSRARFERALKQKEEGRSWSR